MGTLVAALPGIKWGPLHYRALERCKDHAGPTDKVDREIWSWAVQRDIWLTAAYVPGDENHIADFNRQPSAECSNSILVV